MSRDEEALKRHDAHVKRQQDLLLSNPLEIKGPYHYKNLWKNNPRDSQGRIIVRYFMAQGEGEQADLRLHLTKYGFIAPDPVGGGKNDKIKTIFSEWTPTHVRQIEAAHREMESRFNIVYKRVQAQRDADLAYSLAEFEPKRLVTQYNKEEIQAAGVFMPLSPTRIVFNTRVHSAEALRDPAQAQGLRWTILHENLHHWLTHPHEASQCKTYHPRTDHRAISVMSMIHGPSPSRLSGGNRYDFDGLGQQDIVEVERIIGRSPTLKGDATHYTIDYQDKTTRAIHDPDGGVLML